MVVANSSQFMITFLYSPIRLNELIPLYLNEYLQSQTTVYCLLWNLTLEALAFQVGSVTSVSLPTEARVGGDGASMGSRSLGQLFR